MNISLPEALKSFVDQQVAGGGFGTGGDYVRDLIRKDRDRHAVRRLLLDGADSEPGDPADDRYFDGLRQRMKGGSAQ